MYLSPLLLCLMWLEGEGGLRVRGGQIRTSAALLFSSGDGSGSTTAASLYTTSPPNPGLNLNVYQPLVC